MDAFWRRMRFDGSAQSGYVDATATCRDSDVERLDLCLQLSVFVDGISGSAWS
jgi:hypothetical protein